jgi:hypothetical protein
MSSTDPSDDRQTDETDEQKKPYERPRLAAYGNIAAVTRTVGMDGMPDGGKGASKATQP